LLGVVSVRTLHTNYRNACA